MSAPHPLYCSTLQTTSTAATSALIGGGLTIGTGSVALVTTAGKITNLSSVYVAGIASNASGKLLQSDGTNFSDSSSTWPTTTTANNLLYVSATNTVSQLASANSGVLITSVAGVPSISSALPSAVQLNITSTGTVTAGVWNSTYNITSDTTTNTTYYPVWATATGSLAQLSVSTSKMTWNPSTGTLSVTTLSGATAASTLTGTTLASNVVTSSLTTVGALASGSLAAGFTVVTAPLGGTGQSSYTIGDLLSASSTTALSKIADVAVGSYLRSGGVATLPLWSTLTLANAATSGQFAYASATNALDFNPTLTYIAAGNININNNGGSQGLTIGKSSNSNPSSSSIVLTAVGTNTQNVTILTDGTTFKIITDANAGGTNKTIFSANSQAGVQLYGTQTNDDAPAGDYGEYSSSTIASGSAISISTGTAANVTSISLTAGDWMVGGNIIFTQGSGSTWTYQRASTNNTSATTDTSSYGGHSVNFDPCLTIDAGWNCPVKRYSLSTTTVIYLVAQAAFSGGSAQKAYGTLWARRMR